MRLIDIGANLAHDSFDNDRDEVLERAAAVGVSRIVITGSCGDSAQKAVELANSHPGQLFATAGLHPHHAEDWNAELATTFRELSRQPSVVSLGECGLDYFRNLAPHDAQKRAFKAQLELAVDCGKPVFLHQRDAHDDFLAILREYRNHLGSVVVHCFTDTSAALEDYLALDCHIGVTGWICDERRGLGLRESVKLIPDDRLMAETDAPYLLPRNAQPKPSSRRNEPMYLPWVIHALADSRDQPVEHVARITHDNAAAFFNLRTHPPMQADC